MAATAKIDGQLAGCETGQMEPGLSLSFPAAATITVPAASARDAASSKIGENLVSEGRQNGNPSDIETTAHPLATAQLMPARMPPSTPDPSLLRTLPTKMVD
jgi:hypothetical protein